MEGPGWTAMMDQGERYRHVRLRAKACLALLRNGGNQAALDMCYRVQMADLFSNASCNAFEALAAGDVERASISLRYLARLGVKRET